MSCRDGRPAQPSLAGKLHTSYVEVPLPLDDVPTKEQLEQAAQSTDRYQRARAEMQLERLAAGQTLPTTYPYPVQVWTLGDDRCTGSFWAAKWSSTTRCG